MCRKLLPLCLAVVVAFLASVGIWGAPERPYVVVAAGDVACSPEIPRMESACRDADTAAFLEGADAVLMLGDGQYPDGALGRYRAAYHRTWGRYLRITHPVPGNHEYQTPRARGYFAYFGDRAGDPEHGYYAFRLGRWLLLALNSNCWAVEGCGGGSPQYRWLREVLATSSARCILAFWHHPLFTAGRYTGFPEVRPFWELLQAAGAELVLSGHDHNYQRYAPLDSRGRITPRGIRQFVVGTGGRNLYRLRPDPLGAREAATDRSFGVLRLELWPDGYSWRFLAVGDAQFSDHGSETCR
ncbi:MAG: metallophosphoesterase [Armatimonadota bacterium]|nr:metallophosphoesterase [Armatimonadota bacterium]MDR7439760.1 metallophosphoesterase [Armatimonadota bacterium]MDR7562279.1 metallophosphoesterase [Armatimonadota bacterium]MDR7568192.1 metallophosphoesterase [Armatimonadota bacterium]MDR7602879.1 metallophosphoesterase [Armatimonadota bacterium]